MSSRPQPEHSKLPRFEMRMDGEAAENAGGLGVVRVSG